jgi:hypothetical protein
MGSWNEHTMSDNVKHHRVACAGKSVLSTEKRRRTNTPVHALVIRRLWIQTDQ